MFDLNDSSFEEGSLEIFNNGKAGKVNNVLVQDVIKKDSSDVSRKPDYNVVYVDSNGYTVSQGFYYFTPRPGATEEAIKKSMNGEIARVRSLALAVAGDDYQFPTVKSAQEALDVFMKTIKDNKEGKMLNVFATYGTSSNPSTYIGIRKYQFVESANVAESDSKLTVRSSDQLERILPDSQGNNSSESDSSGSSDWV